MVHTEKHLNSFFLCFRKFDYKQFISINYEKELKAFIHRFNLSPDNELLRKALIHRSFFDAGDSAEHNGKLAVLGKKNFAFVCHAYL